MKQVVHFNSQRERLEYLRGGFEEIIPIEVKEEPEKAEKEQSKAEICEKPAKKRSKKSKKDNKDEDNGEILAE